MPLFVCFRGDCDNVALEKAGVFSVQDSQVRTWICYEADGQHDPQNMIWEAMRLQRTLHSQGMSNTGTEIREERCRDREALAVQLGRE